MTHTFKVPLTKTVAWNTSPPGFDLCKLSDMIAYCSSTYADFTLDAYNEIIFTNNEDTVSFCMKWC